jgi:hypothetical protein
MTYVIAEPHSDVKHKATENARFFGTLGSPGGAAMTGPLPYDTDYIASYVVPR